MPVLGWQRVWRHYPAVYVQQQPAKLSTQLLPHSLSLVPCKLQQQLQTSKREERQQEREKLRNENHGVAIMQVK